MEARKLKSINEALDVLEDVSHESSDEIKRIIQKDYKQLRNTLQDLGPEIESQLQDFKRNAKDKLGKINNKTKEVSKKAARSIDHSAKEHPWRFIGSVALAGTALGFYLGRNRH